MEMVGPADIANAVTLNSVVVNAARAIGPAIGGVIIATVGIGACFIFNAVSYVAVIIAMLLIRTSELHPSARTPKAPGQLRDGFRYAWNTPILRTTLVMLVVIGTLTYEFTTTLPLLAEFTFGAGVERARRDDGADGRGRGGRRTRGRRLRRADHASTGVRRRGIRVDGDPRRR